MAEKQSNGNQKVSEQQVRREKLALLQEAGRDPFVQTKFTVTNLMRWRARSSPSPAA